MTINSKTTRERFLDDLETMASWLEDLEARKARAEICLHSSVGLDAAAVQSGRSQSQEAELRLQQTFDKETMTDEVVKKL